VENRLENVLKYMWKNSFGDLVLLYGLFDLAGGVWEYTTGNYVTSSKRTFAKGSLPLQRLRRANDLEVNSKSLAVD